MKKAFWVLSVVALVAVLSVPAFAEGKPDGKALYGSKCAMCHGADGVAKPMAKGSRNFNDAAFTASTDEISKVVMAGKNKMPKMEGKLTAEETAAIAEYVKTLVPKK